MVNSKGGANSNTYLTRLTEISKQFDQMYKKYFSDGNSFTKANNIIKGQSNNTNNNTNYSKRVKGFLDALTNWSKLINDYENNNSNIKIKQKISSSETEIINQYLKTVKNMKEIIETLVESDKNECNQKLAICQAKTEVFKKVLKLPIKNKKNKN